MANYKPPWMIHSSFRCQKDQSQTGGTIVNPVFEHDDVPPPNSLHHLCRWRRGKRARPLRSERGPSLILVCTCSSICTTPKPCAGAWWPVGVCLRRARAYEASLGPGRRQKYQIAPQALPLMSPLQGCYRRRIPGTRK